MLTLLDAACEEIPPPSIDLLNTVSAAQGPQFEIDDGRRDFCPRILLLRRSYLIDFQQMGACLHDKSVNSQLFQSQDPPPREGYSGRRHLRCGFVAYNLVLSCSCVSNIVRSLGYDLVVPL